MIRTLIRATSPLILLAVCGLATQAAPDIVLREFPNRSPVGQDVPPPPEDVAAVPDDAERTVSGLASRVISPGTGTRHPGRNDMVLVHYTGWNTEGVMFDSTKTRNRPRAFRVRQGIPGLAEGVQLMVKGERRRLWVPPELGYQGLTQGPEGMLVFDVELVEVEHAPDPPADLAEPPEDAVTTESGLAYRVVRAGEGAHPGPEDMVLVMFDVWEPDGDLLDSGSMKNSRVEFELSDTIPAFRESFQSMSPGERRLVWSSAKLAALPDEQPPDTDLVFDLELISFQTRMERPDSFWAPPHDAVKSATGLAYKVVRAGIGDKTPAYDGEVVVRYAGWTPDGESFDSSFDRGSPEKFKLDYSMPMGWNEALRSMVVGEERVVWIPADLAVGGGRGWPTGPLVFRMELLDIPE